MKFYSFDEINESGRCVDFAESVLGVSVLHGRCPAIWRGGDGDNVAISAIEWFDHVDKSGGGLLELCAVAKFGGDKQAAQEFLGEWLGLTPKMQTKTFVTGGLQSRYDKLIEQGYKDVKRYSYDDLDGKMVHFVARLEHADKTNEKEFVQGHPGGWGTKGVDRILYRLKDWVGSSYVCIVEGEKDADTLNTLGIPSTTNCGGAEKWESKFNKLFDGKAVAIIRDNDEKGEKHALRVARELKDHARRIAIVCPSKLPKGDVTDWLEKEGGSGEQLIELLKDAPEIDKNALDEIDPVIEAAKEANRWDLKNYTEYDEALPNGGVKKVKNPRKVNDIIDDIHRRFCGFPCRVNGTKYVFDHDHDTGQINFIYSAAGLFSWMGQKSDRRIVWGFGDALVTKSELYEALSQRAKIYEAISTVPDWPKRNEVYYAHDDLPEPSEGYEYFNRFVDFFNPASMGYRTLLKAFICSPLWYINRIPRPGWIVDSEDGAGTGKTTLVELVSSIYSCSPIRTNKQELKQKISELKKRLVSAEGRKGRILLVDNVTGDFHSEDLADLMTAETVSERAAYGRGEEARPNNLTYAITTNSATVDNDLSDRCFFVLVKKPKRSGSWKTEVLRFIDAHRMQILADIIGLLEEHQKTGASIEPKTRFPEFEESILRGVCDSVEEYENAIEALAESRAASNIEDEHAKMIEDEFISKLIDAGINPSEEKVFLRNDVIKLWVNEVFDHEDTINKAPIQYLRNLAKNGLTHLLDAKPEKYPHRGEKRRRGIMWMPEADNGSEPRILGMKGRKVLEII